MNTAECQQPSLQLHNVQCRSVERREDTPGWSERGYRQTSVVYKEVLETKISKTVQYWLDANMSFLRTKKLLAQTFTRFETPRLQLVDAH